MSTTPLSPSLSAAAPQDFFTLHTPAPQPGLPDSLFPVTTAMPSATNPLAPSSAPVPSSAAFAARTSSRPPRPPRSAAPFPAIDPAVAALAAVTAATDASDDDPAAAPIPLPLLPPPPPLAVPVGRRTALGRSTRGVKKPRKPRSPDVGGSPLPAGSSPAPPCKTSLRKSNKPQPFLRLIDNLCNVYAAANAPVTAKTKRERNAAHAKKSDLKAQKYVEVLEKMAVAAARPASPPPSPPSPRRRHASGAAASSASSGAASRRTDVTADTSPDVGEKEKNKLAAGVSIKTQAKAGKSIPPQPTDKRLRQQPRDDLDRHPHTQRNDQRNESPREDDEITASTDVVKSTVSDAMSTSSSVATNSVSRACRCPEVCKKDNAQEDVCLCEVPDSLRRIICEVFPFANKVEPQLSVRARATPNAEGAAVVPKCEKRIVKDTAGPDVPSTKLHASGNATPIATPNEDEQTNSAAMLRSIPSLQQSDRSLSRMISSTPSSKEIDNIPSFSQIVAAGVSMAMDTPPEYKNKYDLFAAAAGSGGASLSKSGNNVFLPEGIQSEFVGRAEAGPVDVKHEYGAKKQADSLCANPSPETVQVAQFAPQQERGSGSAVSPDLYLSPNRWDFGFTMLDQPMLSASNDSGSFMRKSPQEDTPFYANFVSP